MINKFLVRPVLAVATFIKRNPVLAVVLFIVLFLLPTLSAALYIVARWIVSMVEKVFGIELAMKVAEVFTKALNWLDDHNYACPLFAFVIGMVNPLVGGFLAAWCLVDKLKEPVDPTLNETPVPVPPASTTPLPDPTAPDDGDVVNDLFDDYFGAV
jgi:uncharacterized membrane protein